MIAETTDSLTLVGGCVIEAIPCSARSSRGRANGIVILDEAAHFTDTTGNSSLPAVLDALTPPLAQFGPLGLMLVISTPLDASGAFHDLDQQAASGQFDDMAGLHMSTVEAMPQLAADAERERVRNPRRYQREWLGEYSSEDESFPLAAYDQCVDPDYTPPYMDPGRPVVFGLDGAVSRDSMALVGVDLFGNLVYERAWRPPKGGTINHRDVLAEILDLAQRFTMIAVAYDPWGVHGLVLDGHDAGLPMVSVSQAAGYGGGVMARFAAVLIEDLHERRLRLFDAPELRQHITRSRFSARAGGDRLVKQRSSHQIDLAVALAMAVGMLRELELRMCSQPVVEETIVPITDIVDFEPCALHYSDDDPRFARKLASHFGY